MSMSFSEFKKLLGADPFSREPETLSARNSAPEFEQAAATAEAFEHKLRSALHVQPPAGLFADIQTISQQSAERRNWMPFALAASLLIAVGAIGMVWKQSQELAQIEVYLADHYSADGDTFIARAANGISEQAINRVMASLNAAAGKELSERIQYISFCPTPEGRGAHMVVSTPEGPITIIFMPDTRVNDGELVEFDQMHAYLVNLEQGSAAIIGALNQPVETLQLVVKNSLKTGLADV